MAVPDWVSYVSLAGGVIGTISGCLAYRRAGQIKTMDLRLELRRTDEDLRQLIGGLEAHLQRANTSRQSVTTAKGSFNSGSMKLWAAELEADVVKARELEAALPPADADYQDCSSKQLESLLVDRHKLRAEAQKIRATYDAALEQDDKARDRPRSPINRM